MSFKPIHLPGLTGLRSIAALAVVLSHITLSLPEFGLNPHILGTNDDGSPKGLLLAGFGVSIFFALSGFLITYLLLIESEGKPVSISSFYIRRILRIWPLYYIYLIICLLIYFFFDISFNLIYLLYYLFFSANIAFIVNQSLPFLAHFWSIGVEEQFYIFYPCLFRWRSKLLSILGIATILLIFLKLGFWLLEKKTGNTGPLLTLHVSRFHCMMIGGIGAILYYEKKKWFLDFFTNLFIQLICWIIISLVAINIFHIASILDNEIISVVTVIIIIGQVTRTNYILDLEYKVFEFLGKISYGIYVLHPVIIFYSIRLLKGHIINSIFGYVSIYVFVTLITITVAYISYEFFEKKFLKLKRNFTLVDSSPVKI